MPYIKKEDRSKIDEIINLMVKNNIQVNGDLNYLLYAFCKRTIHPSYNNYKNYKAELRECADEIGRKLLGPYEDEKCRINGEV
jgi:hypothetical protein